MCRIEFHAIPRLFDAIPHPYPASRAVPEWMKNLPMERGGGPTLKRCPPFLEAMTAGYIIPVPFDVGLTVSPQGLVSVQCQEMQMISAHFTAQYEGAPFENTAVLKFHNPWVIITPADYVCLITAPFNRFELPFMPLTGIVETDGYYREIHVPSICMLQPGQSATMKRGMPLIQVIPIKRERWGMSTSRQDQEKRRAAEQPFTADRHHYKEAIWKKLEYS
jgi:hypothetical protein